MHTARPLTVHTDALSVCTSGSTSAAARVQVHVRKSLVRTARGAALWRIDIHHVKGPTGGRKIVHPSHFALWALPRPGYKDKFPKRRPSQPSHEHELNEGGRLPGVRVRKISPPLLDSNGPGRHVRFLRHQDRRGSKNNAFVRKLLVGRLFHLLHNSCAWLTTDAHYGGSGPLAAQAWQQCSLRRRQSSARSCGACSSASSGPCSSSHAISRGQVARRKCGAAAVAGTWRITAYRLRPRRWTRCRPRRTRW